MVSQSVRSRLSDFWKKIKKSLANHYKPKHHVMRPDKVCWVCRRPLDSPTREHKLKASDYKAVFGSQKNQMLVQFSDLGEVIRCCPIQGPKSRQLKFDSSICSDCNNSVTQDADLAYSELHSKVLKRSEGYSELEDLQFLETVRTELTVGSKSTLIQRYFGKLIGCHIADSRLPVPIRLSKFVLGERVDLGLSISAALRSERLGLLGHSGLALIFSKITRMPKRYISGRQFEGLEIFFEFELNLAEAIEFMELQEIGLIGRDYYRETTERV